MVTLGIMSIIVMILLAVPGILADMLYLRDVHNQIAPISAEVTQIPTQLRQTVDELGENLRFTFPTSTLFDLGQASLLPDSIEIIDYMVGSLSQYPGHRIVIHSHSDSSLINTLQFPSSYHLTASRAISIANHLIYGHGFDPSLIYPVGLGGYRPVDTNDTSEGRANNRRVEILVLEPVSRLEEYINFNYSTGLLFGAGQASLLPHDVEMIDNIAISLAQYHCYQIIILGHTDSVPINTLQFPSSYHLAAARAISVTNHLIYNHGFDPRLLYPVGLGGYRPLDTNDTPEGRANNRRVEILVFAQ